MCTNTMLCFIGDSQLNGNYHMVFENLLLSRRGWKNMVEFLLQIVLFFSYNSLKWLYLRSETVDSRIVMDVTKEITDRITSAEENTVKIMLDNATRIENILDMGISWCPWL